MSYLLDTNVVSEARKIGTPRVDPGLAAWLTTADPALLFVSAITVFELEVGVLLKMRKDIAQGKMLERWPHERVLPEFKGRILGVDESVALQCARLHAPTTAPFRDSFIAATALVHGLTLVTRNVKDFAPLGVTVLNPWKT